MLLSMITHWGRDQLAVILQAIFYIHFVDEIDLIAIRISLKCVSEASIIKKSELIQVIA